MSEMHNRGTMRCPDLTGGRKMRAGRTPRLACLALAMVLTIVLGGPAAGPAGDRAFHQVQVQSFQGATPGLIPVTAIHAPDAQGRAIVVPAAAANAQERKEDPRLEDWREEGIRMASELTGIPEAFFRWLQDKGVPVGEFMRFLTPFLEWLDMVEPHNGTQSPGRQQRPSGEEPRPTAI